MGDPRAADRQVSEDHRERRRRAHERAAATHDRAAKVHDDAAALYRSLGDPLRMAEQLVAAEVERGRARHDRQIAAAQ